MIPMPPSSPAFSTSGVLPNELYQEIAENLFDPKDRGALFSLALVSKAWSEHSSRILYREFYDHWVHEYGRSKVLLAHTGFLLAVINNPTRYGPLVQTYVQIGFMNMPGYRNQDTAHVQGLTAKALPVMVNLQHLQVISKGTGPIPSNFLDGCTFRLRSLTLLFVLDLHKFFDFLRSQPEMQHLQIGSFGPSPSQTDLSGLPEDVCPNLLSASCAYESMARVYKRRKLMGLETMLDFAAMERLGLSPYTVDVGKLKYLSLWIQTGRRPTSLITLMGSNIDILKLQSNDPEAVVNQISVWHLPNLRLIIILDDHSTSGEPSFQQTLIDTFNRLPSLHYVVVQGFAMMDLVDFRWSISKRDYDGRVSELWRERIHIQRNTIELWWTVYDNV
ncbi:hypothetical protein D9619_009525 [Psilocybe cf. subviscida]|uniref:F-box domain-containing protein n=1 Tax=Psilocybe cf. subviscida TaxID=2480587 RepID=A0A8H5BLR3_9AGAR|nr:hypothetical protein D9619_009525 [Psilocybe cf. subviscida]